MAHAGEDGSASYVNKGLRTQLSTKKFTNELFDRNRKDCRHHKAPVVSPSVA